ncbi:vegetative cell wall protein gp1-like, partial [Temnothorax curvispinosus]|uniref:Vegetative cell wall protein gp1-like n=1 Tax=Temnothorax curvispinosus TaxID=300111 RepID=A0A6J1Q2K4_9HYME
GDNYGEESTDTLPRKDFRGRRDPARRATPYPAPETKALPPPVNPTPAPEIKTLPPLTTASAPAPVPVNPTPVPVIKTKDRILITKVETLPPRRRFQQSKSKTKWRFTPIAKWGHTDPATQKSVEIKSSIPSPTPVLPSPTPAPVPEATTRDPILTSKVETFLPWKLVPISVPAPENIPAPEIQARDSIPISRIETFLPWKLYPIDVPPRAPRVRRPRVPLHPVDPENSVATQTDHIFKTPTRPRFLQTRLSPIPSTPKDLVVPREIIFEKKKSIIKQLFKEQ